MSEVPTFGRSDLRKSALLIACCSGESVVPQTQIWLLRALRCNRGWRTRYAALFNSAARMGRRRRRHPKRGSQCLLELDLGAGRFELLLDVLGLGLGDAFLDGLGSRLDERLGFARGPGRRWHGLP